MKNGWTLPEMAVTLLVVGIVCSEAIPAFRSVEVRSALVSSANSLSAAISEARLAAISKAVPVTFCAGYRATGCRSDWNDGRWIVFVDFDHDGHVDPGDSLLLSGRAAADVNIDGNGPFRTAVVFVPTGMPQRTSGAFAAGRLRVCSSDGDLTPNATDVVLAATGRVRLEDHDFDGGCPRL